MNGKFRTELDGMKLTSFPNTTLLTAQYASTPMSATNVTSVTPSPIKSSWVKIKKKDCEDLFSVVKKKGKNSSCERGVVQGRSRSGSGSGRQLLKTKKKKNTTNTNTAQKNIHDQKDASSSLVSPIPAGMVPAGSTALASDPRIPGMMSAMSTKIACWRLNLTRRLIFGFPERKERVKKARKPLRGMDL